LLLKESYVLFITIIFATVGGRVVIADLNAKDGTQVASDLNAVRENSAIFVQCDVTQRSSIENAVNTGKYFFFICADLT